MLDEPKDILVVGVRRANYEIAINSFPILDLSLIIEDGVFDSSLFKESKMLLIKGDSFDEFFNFLKWVKKDHPDIIFEWEMIEK
jgi:hypothetical protein